MELCPFPQVISIPSPIPHLWLFYVLSPDYSYHWIQDESLNVEWLPAQKVEELFTAYSFKI